MNLRLLSGANRPFLLLGLLIVHIFTPQSLPCTFCRWQCFVFA